MAALVGVWDCLLRPELDARVRPGETRHAVAVATNLRQARLFVRAALSIVSASPLLAELVASASEDEITFANGTALSAFPCTSRGARGWPISTLLMDEAPFFLDTEGNSAAEPIWRALIPATAQFGDGARIIVSSTPFGSAGLFAELFQRAQSGELADAVAKHATTAETNPTIDAAFLERERARDPEGFASEYEAAFLGGGGAFLDRSESPVRSPTALSFRLSSGTPGSLVSTLPSPRIPSGSRSSGATSATRAVGSCSGSRPAHEVRGRPGLGGEPALGRLAW